MPHHTPLIATIVVGLVLAFILGALAHRIRVSPLVGYLLAGVLVGPFTPGFVADPALAGDLAEIGIILLMFGVGLHFSLKDLLSVRSIAVPGALVQIALATALGMGLGWSLGWKLRREPGLWARAFGREHGGAAAGSAGTSSRRDRARAHRRRLADRRGSGDGADLGAAAADCGPARRRGWCGETDRGRTHRRGAGNHLRQGRRFRRS